MMIISNSSPLIALSCLNRLDILQQIFHSVYIPDAVYTETVRDNHIPEQKARIAQAVGDFIQVIPPKIHRLFTRKLGAGEQGVLNLALELSPDLVILDDKKARNEAKELGIPLVFTTDVLRQAEFQQIIPSYATLVHQLTENRIYLPQ